MTEPTDYRARIGEILDETYGINPASEIHRTAALARLVDLFRDLTRDLSEQVAQLKLADADRAAREVLVTTRVQSWSVYEVRRGSGVQVFADLAAAQQWRDKFYPDAPIWTQSAEQTTVYSEWTEAESAGVS